MNIFDAHISGSLSVSSSAEIQGDLTVLGIINATISGNTTSADTASFAPKYTLTSSFYAYSGTTNGRLTAIETSTSSLNTFTSSTDGRLTSIEGVTGSISSLNTYTGSNDTIIGTLQTSTTSLNTFTSSTDGRLTALETSTGSINTYTSSNTTNINAIHTATASLNSYTGSNDIIIGTLQTSTSSLNSFTSSASGRLTAIETATSSLNSYTSSNTTAITALNSFTTSFNTAFGLSGANVTVKGNLTVQGSTTQVDSTTVNIGDNIIQLNGTGATNAGIVVRDATSPTFTSGSFLWDSTNDKWVAGPLGSEDEVVLKTASQALTNKTISGGSNTLTNIGNSSLTNSSITIAGTSTSLGGSITAATILTSTGVWSGSAQLPSGVVSGSAQVLNGSGVWSGSAQLPSGVVSGSSQVSYTGLSNIPTGIVSGSSQITFLSISSIPSGLVSGSSQVLSGTGIWSGSAQLPSGVVSGSSQVLAGTTIHSGAFFNGISVVSGSGQISFNGITDKPTLVSGSSQITYGSLSGIPSGIVSGSSQISFGSISGIPSGLVSGSSQISFGSLSGLPSGLVSGSSQVTLSSTSGFGTYLNQAVLTSSSPSFSSVSATSLAATSTADASGLSLRSTSEVLSGEGWCTALYCYNNNDGFLVVGRDASANARPVFHVGGFNNAGHGGWSDGDAMVTLVRMDGSKSTGSTYSYRGLSNSSYYSNIVKTTSRTEFKDSQGAHYFNGTLTTGGNMTVGGTLTENSSIRYKKDIETISYGLDKVLQLRGVTYVKKENNVKEMGVIAEEIAEILPDVVLYDSEGKVDSVSYGRITAVLIEAIKDLKKEINELKNNG